MTEGKRPEGIPVNNVINKQTALSIGLVLALLIPLVMVVSYVVVANERMKGVNLKVVAIEKYHKEGMVLLHSKLSNLRGDLRKHEVLKAGKAPHPIGATILIEELRKEILHSTDDRWKKGDDQDYMHEFARLNNLKLPPHKRSED